MKAYAYCAITFVVALPAIAQQGVPSSLVQVIPYSQVTTGTLNAVGPFTPTTSGTVRAMFSV